MREGMSCKRECEMNRENNKMERMENLTRREGRTEGGKCDRETQRTERGGEGGECVREIDRERDIYTA